MKLKPLSTVMGTEVSDLDLAVLPSAEAVATLQQALDTTSLLVIRDQQLTPAQQVAASRLFGELEIYPMAQFTLPECPEVLVVSTVIENGKPIGIVDAGQYWHSDSSWRAIPSLGSLLYAREIPAVGGDTLFVNMHLAFEALPPSTQSQLTGLYAEHDYARRNAVLSAAIGGRPKLTDSQSATTPPVVHPVVRSHDGTGRPALFINPGFTASIVGLPEDEGNELLQVLFAHCLEERFTYRHRWLANDLVFWDNRALIHRATPLPPQTRRTMHRTTVKGVAPVSWQG